MWTPLSATLHGFVSQPNQHSHYTYSNLLMRRTDAAEAGAPGGMQFFERVAEHRALTNFVTRRVLPTPAPRDGAT